MLSIDALTKRFGPSAALDGVCLEVGEGEICALLGPNGAGKTTLVSAVAGLVRPDDGEIVVCGTSVWPDPSAITSSIGLAPQDLGVYLILTARDNLSFFGELYGLRGRALTAAIDWVSGILELRGLLDRPLRHMSGGEQRRVHTAMAMLHRPTLLLLDEPTVGVDVQTRMRLLEGVRRLAAEEGTTVVYSTHYLAEVEALGASVAVLDHGRVVARGGLDELIRRYGSPAVELIFDDGPLPDLPGSTASADQNTLRIPCDEPAIAIAGIMDRLGPAAQRVRSVNIARADLEGVFLAVTGRRLDADVADHTRGGAPVRSG